jgi:hypothetical protein
MAKNHTSASNKPKRHHFLPEFYLNGFTGGNVVWVYDREKNEYRPQGPHNTAVIGHYNTVLGTDGKAYLGFEKLLSQAESDAKPVIDKLGIGEMITPEERHNLALFVVLLLTRTPKFEREMEQVADCTAKLLMKRMFPTVEAVVAGLRRYGKKGEDLTPESMFEFIHKEQFQMKGNRNVTVHAMLDLTEKFTLEFACMDWSIVHVYERSAFITTDSPLGFIVPDELQGRPDLDLSLLSQNTTKVVPLTKRMALLVGERGCGFGHFAVDRAVVREINIALAIECERYVIGANESLVRSIVRRGKVDTTKPGSRIRVEHIPHPTDPMRTFLVTRRVAADASNEPLRISVGQ